MATSERDALSLGVVGFGPRGDPVNQKLFAPPPRG